MKEIHREKNRKRKGKFTEEEKAAKTAKKLEQNKIKEKVMWGKLNELNTKFKGIKKHKKEEKKNMSALSVYILYNCKIYVCLKYKNHICPKPAMIVYLLLLTLDR